MRASVILDQLKILRDDEVLSGEKILQWVVGSFEMIDDVTELKMGPNGSVATERFWRDIESKTSTTRFEVNMKRFQKKIDAVLTAIRRVFDRTIRRGNIFACWLTVAEFLQQLYIKCSNHIFILLSAKISVTLLEKFVTSTPDVSTNRTVTDCMLQFWKCGADLVDALDRWKKEGICEPLRDGIKVSDKFLELIGAYPIFTSNVFFPTTSLIMKFGQDSKNRAKFLLAINKAIVWKGESAKNMVSYCNTPETMERLVFLLGIHNGVTQGDRNLILEIIKMSVIYCEDNDIQFDCEWSKLFGETLFSTNDNIKRISYELLLLKARRTLLVSQSNILLEEAAKAYCHFNDRSNQNHLTCLGQDDIANFVKMFGFEVNFVSCDLLRERAGNEPAMCIVLITSIKDVLHTSKANNYIRTHTTLHEKLFHHVQYVKAHPQLLYRVINILDLNSMSVENVTSIKFSVSSAFLKTDHYGTAVELWKILMFIAPNNELDKVIESLIQQLSDDGHSEKAAILLTVIDDTCDIFVQVSVVDRLPVFEEIRKRYLSTKDVRKKLIFAGLLVRALAGYKCSPNNSNVGVEDDNLQSMSPQRVEVEASHVYSFLSTFNIAEETCLHTSMIYGIAVCIHYAKFESKRCGLTMHNVVQRLACVLFKYRQSFELEAQCDKVTDLHLIKKFCRSAIMFFDAHVLCDRDVIPGSIFEYYWVQMVHLETELKDFIHSILRFRSAAPPFQRPYELFAETVVDCVVDAKPIQSVMVIVKKLFNLINASTFAGDAPVIATQIFVKLLGKINSKRKKTFQRILTILYKLHMNDDRRAAVLDIVNERLENVSTVEREILDAFLLDVKAEQQMDVDPPEENISNDAPHQSEPESSNRQQQNDTRVRDSIASINQSICLENQ